MKKLLLIIALIVPAAKLSAQFTYSNPNPLTTTTLQQTSIHANVGNNFYHNTWLLRTSGSPGWPSTHWVDGLSIDNSYNSPTTAKTWWRRDAVNSAHYWGDEGVTYMTLIQGKLGVGTAAPSSPLDVHVGTQSSIATGLSVYRNGDPNFGIKLLTGTGDAPFYNSWNGGIGSWYGIGFHCMLDNTTRGVFDTRNGNFSLKGSINSDANAVFKGGLVYVGQDATGVARIAGPAYSGAIEIKTHSGAGGPTNRYLRLGMVDNTGTFSSALSVSDDLKVGIGSTNPDEKLTVKGKIHAEEIRIDLSVPGPDYVFEKDYKLPALGDIEKFITENKHLPEIPSAKQMETDGIQLSEMNMLLLKKIEELTLYVIAQQKQIDELKLKK